MPIIKSKAINELNRSGDEPAATGFQVHSSIWQRAAVFVRSVYSYAVKGAAPDRVVALRLRSCLGDPARGHPACPHLKLSKEGVKYCGACGCPDWRLAELDLEKQMTKLHFPDLPCPANPPRPGFANSNPPNGGSDADTGEP